LAALSIVVVVVYRVDERRRRWQRELRAPL
jgi:hypothetical protein